MTRDYKNQPLNKTVNRGWLRKEILKGHLKVKRTYLYTDDPIKDKASNYGITTWLEAKIDDTFKESETFAKLRYDKRRDIYRTKKKYVTDKAIYFIPSDFKGQQNGHAWRNKDGTITLNFVNESFVFAAI